MTTTTTIPREVLEKASDVEKDAGTRLRMLLVLKVKYDGIGQNQAARELNCLSSWASKWVRRFEEEGIEGLKTRIRSGRASEGQTQCNREDKEKGREERVRLDCQRGQGAHPKGCKRDIHREARL